MIRTKFLSIFVFSMLAGAFVFQASAQSTKPAAEAIVDSVPNIHKFNEVAISPDGTRIAWVQENIAGIEVASLRQQSSTPTSIPPVGENSSAYDIAWSPDGSQLVFIADAVSKQPQIYIAGIAAGPARKLTDLTGYLTSPSWSPDGKSIAFLYTENLPRAAGPLDPVPPDSGVKAEHIYEQRLALLDITTGKVKQLSPVDMYVYEYDWAPNGKRLAAIAAPGSGDNNWWIARLYTLPAEGGPLLEIYKPALQIEHPRFSPDGKNLAFIEGLMSDAGVVGGDIFIVPSEGGKSRNLTPGMKASASELAWSAPSTIVFEEKVDGNSGIATISDSGEAIKTLWTGFETLSRDNFQVSLTHDGKTSAVIRESFQSPPEIWAGPIGAWKQITHANKDVHPAWGEARNIHWPSDGLRVQGWALTPRAYDPSKKYPLLVLVHGGPASACMPGWPGMNVAPEVMAGFIVLCANPRGSYGQGEAFVQGNVKDFGGGDLRDILAGVDEVEKEFSVDPARVGIYGHSYGGFMTMWATTQTNRFKAAAAGAGLANWKSYYGENEIDQWMLPYFGASVYDNPAVYAKSSPINFVTNLKTPTLITVGDHDAECPAPQSYEWWHALKTLGVPVQFVIYPNEGHSFWRAADRRDVAVRTIEWFDKYLGQAAQASATKSAAKK